MSERRFLEPAAKQRATEVVRAIERETAVEVVVTVKKASGRYLGTSLAFGAACALAGFAVMWLSPQIYDVRTMPLDAALAFALGTGLAASVTGLRRVLTPAAFRRARAERAARATFAELGLAKTRGRTGLLVYVGLFERAVLLVPDSGIPAALVSGPLAGLRETLELSLRNGDLDGFLAALGRLGPACGAALPRLADDENELCDDVA
ncbi:MAG TPA: hypothetical protein VGK73_33675 [Polyangiaceae bacterium]